MIYLTGDMHGEAGRFYYLYKFYNEKNWTKDDYLIVTGDFGFILANDRSENLFLDDLEKRPYTILFVCGNHECFPAIYRYPTAEWHGGKVHQIRRNIYHLMRGQVYDICGKTFFTFGGAFSIDRESRTLGESWWQEELPTSEEYLEGFANLAKHNKKVDYIITHTMPSEMIRAIEMTPHPGESDLTRYLDTVSRGVTFRHWFCGHWHVDRDIGENFTILYRSVRTIT